MHGAGAGYLSSLISGGSARVVEIRADANPAFPGMAQPEPIAHNLAPLFDAVEDNTADIGLATDGDADRLGVVDDDGVFLDYHRDVQPAVHAPFGRAGAVRRSGEIHHHERHGGQGSRSFTASRR